MHEKQSVEKYSVNFKDCDFNIKVKTRTGGRGGYLVAIWKILEEQRHIVILYKIIYDCPKHVYGYQLFGNYFDVLFVNFIVILTFIYLKSSYKSIN